VVNMNNLHLKMALDKRCMKNEKGNTLAI